MTAIQLGALWVAIVGAAVLLGFSEMRWGVILGGVTVSFFVLRLVISLFKVIRTLMRGG